MRLQAAWLSVIFSVGFHHDDPANGCYRGSDAERWFDLTCIHPKPTGHAELADMIMNIVDE